MSLSASARYSNSCMIACRVRIRSNTCVFIFYISRNSVTLRGHTTLEFEINLIRNFSYLELSKSNFWVHDAMMLNGVPDNKPSARFPGRSCALHLRWSCPPLYRGRWNWWTLGNGRALAATWTRPPWGRCGCRRRSSPWMKRTHFVISTFGLKPLKIFTSNIFQGGLILTKTDYAATRRLSRSTIIHRCVHSFWLLLKTTMIFWIDSEKRSLTWLPALVGQILSLGEWRLPDWVAARSPCLCCYRWRRWRG